MRTDMNNAGPGQGGDDESTLDDIDLAEIRAKIAAELAGSEAVPEAA